VEHFVKKDGVIADITYGDGLSWKGFKNIKQYKIIKIDKRKTGEDVIQKDLCEFLRETPDNSFDCIYFDPPHYFSDKVSQLNAEGRNLSDLEEIYCTEDEFNRMIECVGKEAKRVLKNKGVLIMKMIDGYVGREYFPNVFRAFNAVEGLKPLGCFISVMSRKSTSPTLVQVNHIYFLVFIKEEQISSNTKTLRRIVMTKEISKVKSENYIQTSLKEWL
jgi:DNA modification methylase